jgi:hypothetical protein
MAERAINTDLNPFSYRYFAEYSDKKFEEGTSLKTLSFLLLNLSELTVDKTTGMLKDESSEYII